MPGRYEDSYSLTNEDLSKTYIKENPSKNKDNSSVKRGKWTREEDEKLTELVSLYGGKNWKKISELMDCRSSIQCLHRWTKILQPGLVKGPWTIEEDNKLLEWVSKEGPNRWSQCAEYITGRNGKQCRERWFNTLDPQVKKGEWSAEEDYKIFSLFQKLGGKWARITLYFQCRTENSIKNRFYSTLRKLYTVKKREQFPFGNPDALPSMSTSLDELLKYFNMAFTNIKLKFMKMKGFSVDDLMNYDNLILEANYVNENNIKPKEVETKEVPSTINLNVNINNNNNNFQINTNPNNNCNLNNYKNMDIDSLENQIIDMCDNSSFMFSDNNYDNQLDNIIENIFERNNIVVNDDDCNICTKEPTKEGKIVESTNKADILNSLFKQLDDIEQAVQTTKRELMKMEGGKLEKHLNYNSMIDNLFKF